MRNITTVIGATLVLATTAMAVEMANHNNGADPLGAKIVAAAPSPKAESSEIIEIWTQDAPPLEANRVDAQASDADASGALASLSQRPAVDDPAVEANRANVPETGEAKPPNPGVIDANMPSASAPTSADAKIQKAATKDPEAAPSQPAAEPIAAGLPSAPGVVSKPHPSERPRHARLPAPRPHRQLLASRSSSPSRFPGGGAIWRTGGNAYRFSGSFGGCQYRGSITAAGYHIDRGC